VTYDQYFEQMVHHDRSMKTESEISTSGHNVQKLGVGEKIEKYCK